MTPSSPDQLLAAHEDASVGMALVHANGSDVGRFVRVSGALVKMLGHPGQALLDTTLPAITHQDDVDLDSGKWRSLLAGEVSSYEVEKRLVRADGEIVWVQLHASLVHDPEGSPLYTVMRVVDITRLKRTASQLAAVIDSALVAIVTADPEGVILEYNPAAERLFGVSEARAVGSPLDLIVPEERREALMRMFRGEDAHLLGRRMEMNALDADGHEFPVELVIAQIQADPPVFTGFIRDLRETYAAQQALAQSERRFRRIMEATSDGIWAIDVEFRTTFLNRRAAGMIGYEPHELIGRPLLELLEAPSRAPVAEALERRGGNGAAACSATFTHRDQRPVKVLMSATPLLDEEGGQVGSLAMVTDITARLRAEDERAELEARLRQAQRLETVGQLAGGVAHDFNNLLSVIEGYASYVADEVTDRPGAVEGIEEIRRAADRGAKLTRRLLMFSRRDRANPETVDLRTVVDEARPLLEGTLAGQCELAVETPDQPVLVKIDVEQFEQLLLNLAANACDAMPDGGLLAIDLRRVDEGRVQMDVSDTGTGMSEEVAEWDFEPFFTTKPAGDGSGLGLATVYGIVTQSGGEVRLTTTPGVGTRVAVELPAADVEAGKAETPGDRGPRAAHGETILLVEDEDAVRSMAARILRRHGYEVIETLGAEEALAAYRGLDCPPSLVLTDVAMPRMSGVELAARLGKGSPPVVFMSGYTDQSVDNPDALARSAGFLHKPFSAAALLHRVGRHCLCAPIDVPLSDKILGMANETMTAELGSIDGRIAPSSELTIPATDEGLLRGDGVFEVIRVYDGTAFALADHLDRLERSAANLRLPDVFRRELEGEIPELLAARGGSEFDGVLRIVVTRGGRRVLLTEQAAAKPPGVRLGIVIYAPTRVLDNIKSLSYGANMLTTRLAQERGFDEALLVTPHGRVLEAPTSTLFWVDRDGALCTPPLDEHILPSITRDRLVRLLDVDERSCPTEDLLAASEAFLASTVREVQSIGAIEDTEYEEGPRTREAAAAFRAHVEGELGR